MNKYKVLIVAPINGTDRAIGDVVELDTEVADALVASGTLELVEEAAAPVAPADQGQVAAPSAPAGEVAAPAERAITKRSLSMTVVSQSDIDANPLLTELGAVAGDYVSLDKSAQ